MSVNRVYYANRHPLLGRHVNHDDRSRRYEYPTAGLPIVSAKHRRRIPVLDQGDLGSCCGNAGIGCLGTDPYYATIAGNPSSVTAATTIKFHRVQVGSRVQYSLDEAGAVLLYSDATKADNFPGEYPPTDTGSSGLAIAKTLKAHDLIAGYQHTFSLDAALRALGQTPVTLGTVWTNGMFDVDPDGQVHPTGAIAGGHEYVADEIDAEYERVWCTNSWGTQWGRQGRFYLTFDDLGTLLAQQGDVTVLIPRTEPPPTPAPAPADPADAALVLALHHNGWIDHRHVADNHVVQVAAQHWLAAKSL